MLGKIIIVSHMSVEFPFAEWFVFYGILLIKSCAHFVRKV